MLTRREVNRALLATALAFAAGGRAGPSVVEPVRLFDFAIAGGHHYGLAEAQGRLGPGTVLTLAREPGNPHDSDAVAVHRADGLKLGYIPRAANTPVARLLDDGMIVRAVIVRMLDFQLREVPDDLVFTAIGSGDPVIRLTAEVA